MGGCGKTAALHRLWRASRGRSCVEPPTSLRPTPCQALSASQGRLMLGQPLSRNTLTSLGVTCCHHPEKGLSRPCVLGETQA